MLENFLSIRLFENGNPSDVKVELPVVNRYGPINVAKLKFGIKEIVKDGVDGIFRLYNVFVRGSVGIVFNINIKSIIRILCSFFDGRTE